MSGLFIVHHYYISKERLNNMYTVLRISDGEHTFPFLYKDGKVYWPDYNPRAFGKEPRYKISFSYWQNGQQMEPLEQILDPRETLACPRFRHEEYNYQQYTQLESWPPAKLLRHITFTALKRDLNEDPEYTSVQGSNPIDSAQLYIEILNPIEHTYDEPWAHLIVRTYNGLDMPIDNYLLECYGGTEIITEYEIVLASDTDIYWMSQEWQPTEDPRDIMFRLDWPFTKNFEYISGLRFMVVCKNRIFRDGSDIHVDIRSNPLLLTEKLYSVLLYRNSEGTNEMPYTNMLFPDNMNIVKPKIMDKTVQNITEITAHTDSKANIVQPVFFRAREMAHIIVHPEVTENISINLDPYKSQANQFYIKIEGSSFPEIGRVEGGIIFKIKGSLLPGTRHAGTYYILNQDAELVTTGKYTYEF